MSREHDEYQAAECEWYMSNGKHREQRIRQNSADKSYVIGDAAWNHGKEWWATERIEEPMAKALRPLWDRHMANKPTPQHRYGHRNLAKKSPPSPERDKPI